MEDFRVRIGRILTSASLRWSQQANTGAWLSNRRSFRKENLLRIVVVTKISLQSEMFGKGHLSSIRRMYTVPMAPSSSDLIAIGRRRKIATCNVVCYKPLKRRFDIFQELNLRMSGLLPRGRKAYRRAECSGEGGTTWFGRNRIKTISSFALRRKPTYGLVPWVLAHAHSLPSPPVCR